MSSNTLTILGSTGSIGCSTLAVVEQNPQYEIHSLSAHQNVDLLFKQCLKFKPRYAVVSDLKAAELMAKLLSESELETELLTGEESLLSVAADQGSSIVMAAIVGAAGLESTLAAVKAGKKVLLANKEPLVMTGNLLMEAVKTSGATLLPIDSEHNAIFQCLPHVEEGLSKSQTRFVDKLVLTASGGPFLTTDLDKFADITPEQACKHPKWSMGQKISVDSATMMNKGLEFIEACHLFGLAADRVEGVIHPQSIIHSMVHYRDGSVLAQMAAPDMRVPIANGLAWPERIESGANSLELVNEEPLQFYKADLQRFPCLQAGMEAAEQGGTAPAVLNAANEVAVAAFLAGDISFASIPLIIRAVGAKIPCEATPSLAIIRGVDAQARALANELILKDFC